MRDHGLGTALKLLLETLPYAWRGGACCSALPRLARSGLIVAPLAARCGSGTHVATGVFGYCWLLGVLLVGGWIWGARSALHRCAVIACGHVAVLTELITRGSIGNGSEGQFAYGRRIVMDRFGEVSDPVRARRANPGRAARVSQCARYARRLAAGPRHEGGRRSAQHYPVGGHALSGQGGVVPRSGARRR